MRIRFTDNDPALTGEGLNALYTAVGWNRDGRRTPERSERVLEQSPHVVSAWAGERLVGFGRVLADVYAAQLMDVMTHPDFRRQGIAREIVTRLVRYADASGLPLLLISAGASTRLYEPFGFMTADPRTDVLMYRPLPETIKNNPNRG